MNIRIKIDKKNLLLVPPYMQKIKEMNKKMAPLCLAKWALCEGYGNMGCQVSKRGIQNFIYFCQKSTNFRKILDLAIRL